MCWRLSHGFPVHPTVVCTLKSNLDVILFFNVHILQEEIIKQAVNGTLNVLLSCKKDTSLRRVVLTSSSSAVRIRDKFDPEIPLD